MADKVDWPRFFAITKLCNDDIVNMYITGSRAWGTAEEGSDWDFFVVVQQTCAVQFDPPLGNDHMITLDDGDYNVEIMRPSFFWDILIFKNHNVQVRICCFFFKKNETTIALKITLVSNNALSS